MGMDTTLHLVQITPSDVIFSKDLQGDYALPHRFRCSFSYWSPYTDEDDANMWGWSMEYFRDGQSPEIQHVFELISHEGPKNKLHWNIVERIGKQFNIDNMYDLSWAFVTLEEYKNRAERYELGFVPFLEEIEDYIYAHQKADSTWLILVRQDQPNRR